MARRKHSHTTNLEKIKDIISRQLSLIEKASLEGIINDKFSRMFCEYAKITLLSLKEERDSLKNLDLDSMTEQELRDLLKKEMKELGDEVKEETIQ